MEKLGDIIRVNNENGNGFKLCHRTHVKENGEGMRVYSRKLSRAVIRREARRKDSTFLCGFEVSGAH